MPPKRSKSSKRSLESSLEGVTDKPEKQTSNSSRHPSLDAARGQIRNQKPDTLEQKLKFLELKGAEKVVGQTPKAEAEGSSSSRESAVRGDMLSLQRPDPLQQFLEDLRSKKIYSESKRSIKLIGQIPTTEISSLFGEHEKLFLKELTQDSKYIRKSLKNNSLINCMKGDLNSILAGLTSLDALGHDTEDLQAEKRRLDFLCEEYQFLRYCFLRLDNIFKEMAFRNSDQ